MRATHETTNILRDASTFRLVLVDCLQVSDDLETVASKKQDKKRSSYATEQYQEYRIYW